VHHVTLKTMQNKPRGMKVLRALDEDEKRLIEEVYHSVASTLLKTSTEITWTNLLTDGKYPIPYPQHSQFDAWVKRIVSEVYHAWPEVHLLGYGFIFNAAGSTKNQRWHEDYTSTASTVFVPLTKITCKNTTQFLDVYIERENRNKAVDVEDYLEMQGLEGIVVSQLICRPFSLVQVIPGTVHRGIANQENFDRIMFYLTVDDHYYELNESAQVASSYYFPELKD